MSYTPYPAGTMLIPSGPADHKHLFIVVTKLCVDGQHLLFSVSSVKPHVGYDEACELTGGEHEFIAKHSYIYYRKPDRRRADNISRMVEKKYFILKNDLAKTHFERVCAGITLSKFTTPATLKYFRANSP